MPTIWFNHGYSSIRDALIMIREGAGEANRLAGTPTSDLRPPDLRASDLRLIASHRDPQAAVLDAADIGLPEPAFDRTTEEGEATFVAWCLETCRIHGVDLFVPQGGRSLIAARADDFAAIGTRIAVPASADMLALIEDKAAFYEAALDVGLPMPWTREIGDVAGFDAALADCMAAQLEPCIKPPQGVFGAGFWRLDPDRDLFATLMNPDSHVIAPDVVRLALDTAPADTRLLVLEYLAGVEWSLDCVCKDGRLVVGVARRKAGRAQLLEAEGPVFDIARKAVAAFGLSGLINVQCRAANVDDSDIRLLEINTRMSGGCLYTRYAGVNLPWLHIALELGLVAADDMPVPQGGALVAAIGEAMLIADRAPQVPVDA